MSPDKPELREAVAEQHHGLPIVLLSVDPRLHIVKPHSVDLDVVMAAVLRVQQTVGGNSASLHLEQSQSDQQQSETEPSQSWEEEDGPDTNSHNPGRLHVERTTQSSLFSVNSYLHFFFTNSVAFQQCSVRHGAKQMKS